MRITSPKISAVCSTRRFRLKDRREPFTIAWIGQLHPKFRLDPCIGDPFALGIKTARHWAEVCGCEIHLGGRWQAQERSAIAQHIFGRGGFVITQVVNRPGVWTRNRCGQSCRDILDMDARENLPRLDDPAGRATAQFFKRATAGAIDAGKSKDVQREPGFCRERLPCGFGHKSGLAAFSAWSEGGGFIDPPTLVVTVDSGGGEIPDPLQMRCGFGDGVGLSGQNRVARGCGRDGGQQVCCFGQGWAKRCSGPQKRLYTGRNEGIHTPPRGAYDLPALRLQSLRQSGRAIAMAK